ncbi:uncharacterized protein METZ01_LOCUS37619 [marine metagenome]|uniref:Uncharacterized protein n=1 Tax=marine metagenome TaxID=408172 RepID=A0A381QZ88_9ZZZZ
MVDETSLRSGSAALPRLFGADRASAVDRADEAPWRADSSA